MRSRGPDKQSQSKCEYRSPVEIHINRSTLSPEFIFGCSFPLQKSALCDETSHQRADDGVQRQYCLMSKEDHGKEQTQIGGVERSQAISGYRQIEFNDGFHQVKNPLEP